MENICHTLSIMSLFCQNELPLFSVLVSVSEQKQMRVLGICINLWAIAKATVCDLKNVD